MLVSSWSLLNDAGHLSSQIDLSPDNDSQMSGAALKASACHILLQQQTINSLIAAQQPILIIHQL